MKKPCKCRVYFFTYPVWQGAGVLMVSVPRRGEKTNAYHRYTSPKQYRTYSSAWTLSYKIYMLIHLFKRRRKDLKDLPTSGQGFALPRHHALHPNTKANDEATFNLYALYVFVLTTPLGEIYQECIKTSMLLYYKLFSICQKKRDYFWYTLVIRKNEVLIGNYWKNMN